MVLKYVLICAIVVNQSTLLQISPMCNVVNRTDYSAFSCIDDRKKNVYNECFETKFCAKNNNFELKSLPECPKGFSDAEQFCYTLSKTSVFPPNCPFNNTLPFDSYKHVIAEKNLGPVWMPVHRNLTNGLGFLQWTEHSRLYKTAFEDPFFFEGGIKNKNCLVYHNSSYIIGVSCLESYQGVCAYTKLHRKQGTLCETFDNCVSSTLNAKSRCICLETSTNTTRHKAEFLEPYQNNIYKILTNETCEIGLEKFSNGTLVWTRSGQEIDYSFWSPEVVFVDTKFYIASSPTGWLLSEQPLSCSFVARNLPEEFPTVILTLTYKTDFNFVLNIYFSSKVNSNFTIYCFTDADSSTLLYRYINLTLISQNNTQAVYEFQRLNTGSGNYWCEGFTYFEANAISSNVLSFQNDVFIGTIRLKYNESINPLNPEIIGLLKEHLLDTHCPYRLIKINDFDEDKKYLSINVGFECSPSKIQRSLIDMNNVNFKIVSVLAVEYCPEIVDNGLTWPETAAGFETYSEEYCFKIDGFRLGRLCVEDPIKGAYWAELTETCEIPEKSSVTDKLLSLISLSGEEIVSQLPEILNAYTEFVPFDVYLTSEYFNNPQHILFSIEVFGNVVDNILMIDSKILMESQLKFHATDIWLETIFKYLFSSYVYGIVLETNIMFAVFQYYHDINAVVVQNIENKLQVIEIPEGTSLYEILTTENFESGIYVGPENSMGEETRVIANFFNAGFFPHELSEYAYAIYQFEGTEFSEGEYTVFYKFKEDQFTQNVKCVVWDSSSAWTVEGQFEIYKSSFTCSFVRWGGLALLLTSPDTVTQSLIDILTSDAASVEIISRLVQVVFRYNEFSSTDVFLTAAIIKKLSDQKVNLELLTQIVNYIQNIERDNLVESQKLQMATDEILYYTDVIIENQEYTGDVLIVEDNFISLIYKCDDFSGLVLLDNNEVVILNGSVDISVLLTYKNLVSALVLSPKLKDQLSQNSKIIVNIYLKDVLFNENKNVIYETVSTIFDVVLPEIEGNFSGPISTFHKMDSQTMYQNACVYWQYNVPENIPGFWKKDNETKASSSLIQCDFWHATHFGSVLLGADKDRYTETEMISLQWITNVNCTLSLIGFMGIILTALVCENWRQQIKNKVLLYFSLSGMFQMVAFLIADNTDKYFENYALCVISGVLVHYSVLVQFCWTFLLAFFQFRASVLKKRYNFEQLMKKSTIFVMTLPLLIVVIVLVINFDSYAKSKTGICYPADSALYYGVWWPISVILTFNLTTCFFVYNAIRTEHRVKRTALLFFLLGLTWIFGFIAEISLSVVFVYLFDFLVTFQGVILFLNFASRDLTRSLKNSVMNKNYFSDKILQFQNFWEHLTFVYLDEIWIYQNGSVSRRRWVHESDLKSETLKDSGYEILRLPPYHCQYNPTKMAWGFYVSWAPSFGHNANDHQRKRVTKNGNTTRTYYLLSPPGRQLNMRAGYHTQTGFLFININKGIIFSLVGNVATYYITMIQINENQYQKCG
ncbi:uncharacterized protein LOC135124469 [Zophobas morio]|uniref:uncharacterized protein LOC135124469 n=1 Tax=Zophobas morio TaxID=2755281 RepID=UPI003083DCA0